MFKSARIVRFQSFRHILALAFQFDLQIHHMDVVTAFSNGKLKEKINIKVYKFNRSLYGLEQAAKCWY